MTVFTPFLFGIFIDDLVKLVNKANVGCKMGTSCAAIFLYENLYSPHNSDSSSDKIDTKYTTKIIKINLIRTC